MRREVLDRRWECLGSSNAFFEFEEAIVHPAFDVCQAVCCGGESDWSIVGLAVEMKSRVAYVSTGYNVEEEEEGTKQRAFRDTIGDGCCGICRFCHSIVISLLSLSAPCKKSLASFFYTVLNGQC